MCFEIRSLAALRFFIFNFLSLQNLLQEVCKKDKEESLSELYVQLEAEKSRLKEASKDSERKDEISKQMKNDLECAKKDLNELRIIQNSRFFCYLI